MPPAITLAQLNFICIRLADAVSSSCSLVQPGAQLCRFGLREALTHNNSQYPAGPTTTTPSQAFAPAPSVTTFEVLLKTRDRDLPLEEEL